MHPYKETTIHKLYTGREARLNFAYCTFKRHMVQKWAHTHCLAAKLGSYSMNIQTLMVMPVWHPFMKCHYLLLGLCGVLWAVCGVLWAVWCAACGVLWAVCCVCECVSVCVCVVSFFLLFLFFIFGSWDHKFTPKHQCILTPFVAHLFNYNSICNFFARQRHQPTQQTVLSI